MLAVLLPFEGGPRKRVPARTGPVGSTLIP